MSAGSSLPAYYVIVARSIACSYMGGAPQTKSWRTAQCRFWRPAPTAPARKRHQKSTTLPACAAQGRSPSQLLRLPRWTLLSSQPCDSSYGSAPNFRPALGLPTSEVRSPQLTWQLGNWAARPLPQFRSPAPGPPVARLWSGTAPRSDSTLRLLDQRATSSPASWTSRQL